MAQSVEEMTGIDYERVDDYAPWAVNVFVEHANRSVKVVATPEQMAAVIEIASDANERGEREFITFDHVDRDGKITGLKTVIDGMRITGFSYKGDQGEDT